MMRWLRKPADEPLPVSMSSIKLGDRLLFIGCSDVGLIASLAAKSGLTGRTCIVDKSEPVTSQAATAVEREGVLVETFTAPNWSLPFPADSFDVAVIRNLLGELGVEEAPGLTAEVRRVLRPGGRVIVIEGHTRGGLSGLFQGSRGRADAATAQNLEQALSTGGFRAVRTLTRREGLIFVEGVKRGTG